jgi:hypothetical protein
MKILLNTDGTAGGATPAAQPAAAPAAAPAEKPKINDPFASLTIKKEEPKPDPKPKADGDKPADDKPKEGDDKPKADEGQPADKKTAVRKDPVAEQRKRIEEQNKIIETERREKEEFKRKLDEFQKNGGDAPAFAEKAKQDEARIKQLEGELAARDYSKHPDFIAKFEKPWSDAAEYGRKIIESLEVIEDDGTTRQADWKKDFAGLYNLPRSAARQKAKELFGEDSVSVMSQYDELHRLDEGRNKALQDWQSGADERSKKERAEHVARLEAATNAFKSATKDMTDANAEIFSDSAEDTEENELRKQSMSLVDAAYFGRDKLNPQELLVLDAAVRLRAAHFPILQRRLEKALAQVKEYEARINGEEASANGKTARRGGDQTENKPTDWKSDLRAALAT